MGRQQKALLERRPQKGDKEETKRLHRAPQFAGCGRQWPSQVSSMLQNQEMTTMPGLDQPAPNLALSIFIGLPADQQQ